MACATIATSIEFNFIIVINPLSTTSTYSFPSSVTELIEGAFGYNGNKKKKYKMCVDIS